MLSVNLSVSRFFVFFALKSGARINDPTLKFDSCDDQSPSLCLSSCLLHVNGITYLHVVQSSVTSYTAALLPLTDYDLLLHCNEKSNVQISSLCHAGGLTRWLFSIFSALIPLLSRWKEDKFIRAFFLPLQWFPHPRHS